MHADTVPLASSGRAGHRQTRALRRVDAGGGLRHWGEHRPRGGARSVGRAGPGRLHARRTGHHGACGSAGAGVGRAPGGRAGGRDGAGAAGHAHHRRRHHLADARRAHHRPRPCQLRWQRAWRGESAGGSERVGKGAAGSGIRAPGEA
eukprot:1714965-Rhodomonas_salina.1